jgi:hypothetical protein
VETNKHCVVNFLTRIIGRDRFFQVIPGNSLDIIKMNSQKSGSHFGSKLAQHLLIIAVCILLLPSPGFSAVCGEICKKSAFPSVCNALTTDTIFWWPSAAGDRALQLPRHPRTRNISLYSSSTLPRRLTVNGSLNSSIEIFVGSPGTADTFNGSGGPNTFVVGGLSDSAVIKSGTADEKPTLLYTSSEGDEVNIASNPLPDFVHINSIYQSGNYNIKIATAVGPVFMTVRGAGELMNPVAASCPVSWNPGSEQFPIPRLAFMLASWPSFIDAQMNIDRWFVGLLSIFKPNPLAKPSPFPGVASIAGIDVSPASVDRIFLPAEEFTFNGKRLSELEDLPILGIKDVRFGPSKNVDQKVLEKLLAESQGLPGIPTNIAPLIYFQDEGLLVSSQNSEPLGSRANPGKPIVRLLDRRGRPQALTPDNREGLKLAPNQSLYQSPFLVFEPTQTADNFSITKESSNL